MLICPKIIGSPVSIEAYKAQLRREHVLRDSVGSFTGMDAYQAAREAACTFWSMYERVNREFCPEDPVYSVVRTGYTTIAATDVITYSTVAASRKIRLLEMIIGSEATTSAGHRFVWQVSTGGATSVSGNVPEKFDIDSPASMFAAANVVFSWTTQPTLSGQPKIGWAFNELGGYVDWKAAPGSEVYHRNSEQVSFRSVIGTGVITCTVIHEEL